MAVTDLAPDTHPPSSHPSDADFPPAQLSRWQRFNVAAEDPTSTVQLWLMIITLSTCLISTANFVFVAINSPAELYERFMLVCVGLNALGFGSLTRTQWARRQSAFELKRTRGDILADREKHAGQILLEGGSKE